MDKYQDAKQPCRHFKMGMLFSLCQQALCEAAVEGGGSLVGLANETGDQCLSGTDEAGRGQREARKVHDKRADGDKISERLIKRMNNW